MKVNITMGILVSSLWLAGCANEAALGHHVAKLKSLQTYNPEATQTNKDVIPDGNGERMEDVYNIYTGKKVEAFKETGQSRVLNDF